MKWETVCSGRVTGNRGVRWLCLKGSVRGCVSSWIPSDVNVIFIDVDRRASIRCRETRRRHGFVAEKFDKRNTVLKSHTREETPLLKRRLKYVTRFFIYRDFLTPIRLGADDNYAPRCLGRTRISSIWQPTRLFMYTIHVASLGLIVDIRHTFSKLFYAHYNRAWRNTVSIKIKRLTATTCVSSCVADRWSKSNSQRIMRN